MTISSRVARGLLYLLPALLTGLPVPSIAAEETGARECVAPAGVASAYKGVFYDNDFGYVADACLAESDSRSFVERATDKLKLIEIAPRVSLSLGGETRLRYHNEDGLGSSRLDGLEDEFVLTRVRAYADVRVTDYFRGFVEVIDARKSGGLGHARSIEVVRGDVLNGFAEIGAPVAGGRAYARAGRQELLFGAQRLISPLDWGNTRRSFDGVRGGYVKGDFELHGFFVNPRIIANRSSRRNEKVDFSGAYGIWRGLPGQIVEFYALNLDGDPQDGPDSNFWTFGGHIKGGYGRLLWELESAIQTGDIGTEDMKAAMLTVGLGVDLSGWLPKGTSVWGYYDRASGDGNAQDGERRTFNQLFPLAHAFFGAMDLVARQNIEAFSVKASTKPHRMVTAALVFHDFDLEEAADALYNAGGAAIRRDPTGQAGSDVGRELDAILRIAPARWLDVELGFARFWAGDFIERTSGPGVSGNADFFYLQTRVRY